MKPSASDSDVAPPRRRAAPSAAIARWRRRVVLGLALGGFADATGVLCALLAAAILALRAFGVGVEPSAWWAVALVGPAAYAFVRARRGTPTDAECAVPLDRRLGLDGLLVAGLEVETGAWSGALGPRLSPSNTRAALPRIRLGRLAARALPAVALLCGVLLLPPPKAQAPSVNAAVEEALRRFEERLDVLAKEPTLAEQAKEPLRERLEELRREAERGENVAWSDVDALAERIDRSAEEKAAALEKARAALTEAAKGGTDPADGRTARERMTAGLEAASEAGLLATLPPELAKALGIDPTAAGGKLDPSALSADAKTLEAVAKALAATAGERLGELSKAGLVDPSQLEALQKLLASDPKSNPFEKGDRMCPKCHGQRPEGCGT